MGLIGREGNFGIQKGDQQVMEIDGLNGDVTFRGNVKIDQSLKLGLHSQFQVNGVSQWLMIHEESGDTFDLKKWSVVDNLSKKFEMSNCGGLPMLGGYSQLSSETLSTTVSLKNYDAFTHLKFEALFHFIDAWSGETAFMRLLQPQTQTSPALRNTPSYTYLWTDSFDFTQTKNSINICGSEVGEGKFTSIAEGVVNRDQIQGDKESITIQIGTTLSADPMYSSYGISAFRVYIR
eukprot:403356353